MNEDKITEKERENIIDELTEMMPRIKRSDIAKRVEQACQKSKRELVKKVVDCEYSIAALDPF